MSSLIKKKDRYQFVIDYFTQNMPQAETELSYETPFQLLVAVILSAQCTDKRVNMSTPAIFKKFPTPLAMSQASFEDLFDLIKSISYPSNKTKHLIGTAQMLIQKFNAKVPLTVDELIQLPGVGRKTANVITSVIDHQPNMAVDTHVFRVSARIGLTTRAKTPLAAEKQLISCFPKSLIHKAHHWLILHGRYTCTARNPQCQDCKISKVCNFFKENDQREMKLQKKSVNL